jgi:hypothetical protein
MSDQPDKSGTTTGQVWWGFLESGLSSLEAGQWPDKYDPLDKSSGGIELVWYLSLEADRKLLESGGFTGQVQ